MTWKLVYTTYAQKDARKLASRGLKANAQELLTSRGRGIAVVQGLEDYENTAEELRFVKAVVQGLMDVRDGNTVSLDEARKALDIG